MMRQLAAAALVTMVGAATVHKLAKPRAAGAAATAAPTPAPRPPQPRRAAVYGTNLAPLYSSRERAFMNLMAGGEWTVHPANDGFKSIEPERVDRDSTVLSLHPGELAALTMTRPPASHVRPVPVHCTFEGRGEVQAFITDKSTQGRNTLDFIWPKGDGQASIFFINKTDPADPVRHIDCREAGADRSALFDPAFVEMVKPFKAIRFMDWQMANNNQPFSWSQRTLPTAMIQYSVRGPAIEHMVALANLAGVDPWFNLPYNSDDASIAAFAHYVHDHLDKSRKVYLELGNETWNYSFAIASQLLQDEDKQQADPDRNVGRMLIYVDHALRDFKIWQDAFGADSGRLVRVLGAQAVYPELLQLALDRRNVTNRVDAIAVAPYFGGELKDEDARDMDALFRSLTKQVDDSAAVMKKDKAVADHYGLRLIAYEAGQSLSYNGTDKTLMARVNRDPRMGDLYRRYLAAWNREAGDLMMLFTDIGEIGPGAAWGMTEYIGQPLSEAPKRAAVLDVIAAGRH